MDFIAYAKYRGVSLNMVVLSDFEQVIDVKVYNGSNVLIGHIEDSVAGYLSRASIGNLNQAVAKFASSVRMYLLSK